jgi:ATP-dependent helicase/nuclease subunit B
MNTKTPRLVLGWWLDGAPGPGLNFLTATVGPIGFIDLLTTWSGIATRPQPGPVRIAACLAAMRECTQDAFWSVSFATDSWSTAHAVLALRDALRMAGWQGTAGTGAPRRIADIARLADVFPPGEPDLLADIVAALQGRRIKTLPAVTLAEPAALWPFAWRRLFDALKRQGVAIDDLALPPATAGDDLEALKATMQNGTASTWRGDGSLCLLTSETESEAADVLSAWIGSADTTGLALVKADGGLLDPFLRARHLPRLGGASESDGLLPLALALRWDPFDAAAALAFLSLHRTPLGVAARFLSDAIENSPGHGGPMFRSGVRLAVRNLLRRLRDEGAERSRRKQQARELVTEIDFWLPAERRSRAEGLPAADVLMLCERLVAWAHRRQDPGSAAPAAALAAAVAALRQDRLMPTLLGRMLDAVAAAGAEDHQAEAAAWRHAVAPGALISPAETVVWWLTDPPAGSPAPWRAAERIWMAEHGLEPDDAVARRGREQTALFRAVSRATSRLVLVRPRAADGEAAPAHPLLADLHACFGDSLDGAWIEAGSLRRGGIIGGRTLPTTELQAVSPPPARRDWTVPAGAVIGRNVESPSGMETLLACRLAWVLRYGARLRIHGPAALPDMDRLTGSFVHRVLQRLFESRAAAPDGSAGRARDIFERLLPQEAAPLLQPGQEATRARALTLLTEAVAVLTRRLAASGLEVEAVERTLRRPMPNGTVLEGRLDLLLRRPSDNLRLVLDAKWTRSGKRHRAALAGDESVQLAAYAWLAEALGWNVNAGYFLLRQARLYTARAEPIDDTAVAGADLPRAWDRAMRTYAAELAAVQAGRIVAAGVPDTIVSEQDQEDRLELAPPCDWCDYRPLCGATMNGH